ncbi:hypothetical protein BMI90_06050 [Thioclava sp. L04-15]|uniref:type I secretion system permease/ATPase n=1 Tax=Thioclava sp. L04-15 TaxID=1915318 RepID=UPI000996026E|nr:type I secretion system permease/ATPase [Thioclava sp. L04-15]OOY29782.1 hypothetical protein BMI90_06050 [Thioclava sp. L04-15]TNE85735.1 MAG: type I secretion system permease/ATPase [Paracoccaceae bacterium]
MPIVTREEPASRGRLIRTGQAEIARLLRGEGKNITLVALFGALVNVLMLTGPLFMLQVYDRVLPAHSLPTLINLFALVVFLFAMMGTLDWARGRLLARLGADFQTRLEKRVFDASIRSATDPNSEITAHNALRDLEAIQRYYGSPVSQARFDLPWTPLYLGVLFVFHPWLGWLATAGGALLVLLSALTQHFTRHRLGDASRLETASRRLADTLLKDIETVTAMGMRDTGFARWRDSRHRAMAASIRATDLSGSFHSLTRTLRMLLQSTMLALGAYLVLKSEVTPGAMVASSILMGRALAPVEQLIGGWTVWSGARDARHRLSLLLGAMPVTERRTELAPPAARLSVEDISVTIQGASRPSLDTISFTLEPGEALGVIGPAGSGKTTLARALCNNQTLNSGEILLDEVCLHQYDPDRLARHIGYLPQRVTFFEGTLAENIARLDRDPDPAQVIEAARRAGAHRMILDLPNGYDTRIDLHDSVLSDRQRQQIALARALYCDPVILLLDEPDLNLTSDSGTALNASIRDLKSRDGAVIVMANSPAALAECDRVLVLDHGVKRILGPRDDILRRLITSANRAQPALKKRGAA